MTDVYFFKQGKTLSRQLNINISISDIKIESLPTFEYEQNSDINSEKEDIVIFTQFDCLKIKPTFLNKKYQFIYTSQISSEQDSLMLVSWDENEKDRVIEYHNLAKKEEIFIKSYNFNKELNNIYILKKSKKLLCIYKQSEAEIILNTIELREEKKFVGHSDRIISISILENINAFASIGYDKLVKVWNLDTGVCVNTFKIPSICDELLLASKTRIIGWEGESGFWVWDLRNNIYLIQNDEIRPVVVKVKEINSIQYIFVGRDDGILDCYLLSSGKLIWSKLVKNDWIYNFEISQDNSLLIIGGADDDIHIVDSLSGEFKGNLRGHQGGIWNILVTNNNIITSGLDEVIRVWDIYSFQCIAILTGHVHKIRQMHLTNDRKYLISRDKMGYLLTWEADWNNSFTKSDRL